jgi:hypothetical protein
MPELGYAPVNQYLPPRPSQARAGCTGAQALPAVEDDVTPAGGSCAGSIGCCRGKTETRCIQPIPSSSSPARPAAATMLLALLGLFGALGLLPPIRAGVVGFGSASAW